MYKLYRRISPDSKWKYIDTYNSTLDPNYHSTINYLNSQKWDWVLIRTSDSVIMFSSSGEGVREGFAEYLRQKQSYVKRSDHKI